jgi:hypothetical protein
VVRIEQKKIEEKFMNGERAEPKRNAEHCDKHGIGCLAPKIQRFGSQVIFQSEFKAQNYLAEASESRSGRDLAILATKYAMKKYTAMNSNYYRWRLQQI